MSIRSGRLGRVAKGFEARSKSLQTRMAALAREMNETEIATAEIERAMASPLVHALSLQAPAVRRIASLKQKSHGLGLQLAQLRSEAIGARTSAKLASGLRDKIDAVEFRKQDEKQSLEVTAVMSASSLRQVTDA